MFATAANLAQQPLASAPPMCLSALTIALPAPGPGVAAAAAGVEFLRYLRVCAVASLGALLSFQAIGLLVFVLVVGRRRLVTRRSLEMSFVGSTDVRCATVVGHLRWVCCRLLVERLVPSGLGTPVLSRVLLSL